MKGIFAWKNVSIKFEITLLCIHMPYDSSISPSVSFGTFFSLFKSPFRSSVSLLDFQSDVHVALQTVEFTLRFKINYIVLYVLTTSKTH